MKLLTLFLLASQLAYAKTIYVNPTGEVSTIEQVNQLTLNPGDSVLFRGDKVFYGSLLTQPGVYYGSYDGRATITGFKTISDWNATGNGVFESREEVSSLPTLTMVLVNGVQQPMGRYPNGKDNWIYATSVNSGTPPITVEFKGNLPADFSGAHIVQRKHHWIFDHNLVVQNAPGSITYTALPNSTTREPFQPGYGFFIENHPATLDVPGEWYFNPTTKKLLVFMGKSMLPVQVATVQWTVVAAENITIENLNMEGSNDHLVNVTGNNVTIQGCSLQYAGRSGISVNFKVWQNLKIINNRIRYVNDMGIYGDYRGGDNFVITGNSITDIGLIPGTGGWGDFGQTAIHCSGSNARIENNVIKRIGYTAIKFGNKVDNLVQYNLIDSVCLTKDDGSGIYTYRGSSNKPASGNRVAYNIILNCIGNPNGTPQAAEQRFDAYGIYMDENATGVTIMNNTVIGARYGIFNNSANFITYSNNTIANCEVPVTIWKANGKYPIQGLVLTNNIYVARPNKFNPAIQWWETSGQNTIASWGKSDSNTILSPFKNCIAGVAPGWSNWKNHTLTEWKASTTFGNKDINSQYIVYKSTPRVEYNSTASPRVVKLDKPYTDPAGKIYSATATVAPFSSKVLIAK